VEFQWALGRVKAVREIIGYRRVKCRSSGGLAETVRLVVCWDAVRLVVLLKDGSVTFVFFCGATDRIYWVLILHASLFYFVYVFFKENLKRWTVCFLLLDSHTKRKIINYLAVWHFGEPARSLLIKKLLTLSQKFDFFLLVCRPSTLETDLVYFVGISVFCKNENIWAVVISVSCDKCGYDEFLVTP